jgi:hypothetical protein
MPCAYVVVPYGCSALIGFHQRSFPILTTSNNVSLGAEERREWKERGTLLLFNPLCFYLIFLAELREGRNLLGHLDDSLDAQVRQVYHAK